MDSVTPGSRLDRFLRLIGAEREELPALAWSFLYFFVLLSAYYVLRPVRDALGTPYPLPLLFLGTFVCMLLITPIYGAVVARFPRRTFLPLVYGFFIACLFAFYGMMRADLGGIWRDAGFFIWVAVFNLFAVSVFWSFMSDIFESAQARRLFGAIGAGGTTGTLVGSMVTVVLATRIGTENLLLVSAALLGVCLLCIHKLVPWAQQNEQRRGWKSGEDSIGGSIIGGALLIRKSRFLFACCLLMFCGVAVGTLLYNQQQAFARIAIPDTDVRTAFFGRLDLAINGLVLLLQLSLTRLVMTRYGVGPMLLIPSMIVGVGFAILTASPTPLMLSLVQIVTRAGNFAMVQPARESLFTRVDRESRYKSKNFIDTVVYRGGDLTFAAVFTFMTYGLGVGLASVAVLGVIMAIGMGLSAAWVVRLHRAMPAAAREREPS